MSEKDEINTGKDLDQIRSESDELLKLLDEENVSVIDQEQSDSIKISPKAASPSVTARKNTSLVTIILAAAGSLTVLVGTIIMGIIGTEYAKQQTLARQAELAKQEALARKEEAAKQQAARERADRERAAKELADRNRLFGLRARLESDGWYKVGASGLFYRLCHELVNDAKLGPNCEGSKPGGSLWSYWWGIEVYCASEKCDGYLTLAMNDKTAQDWNDYVLTKDLDRIDLREDQKKILTITNDKNMNSTWVIRGLGYCVNPDSTWKSC